MPTAIKRQTIGKVEAIEGSGIPTDAPGIPAERASQYQDTVTGDQWLKVGPADVDWLRLEKATDEQEIFAKENISPTNLDASDTARFDLVDINLLCPLITLPSNEQYIIKIMGKTSQTGAPSEGVIGDTAFLTRTFTAETDGASVWTNFFAQDDLTDFNGGGNDNEMNIDIDFSIAGNLVMTVSNGADIGAGSSGREMFWHGRMEIFFQRSFT